MCSFKNVDHADLKMIMLGLYEDADWLKDKKKKKKKFMETPEVTLRNLIPRMMLQIQPRF